MNNFDLIIMGLKNLFRRKLRTFLTTLGIIIGTISIVVMVSLGIGMRQSIEKSLSEWGSIDIITVTLPRENNNGDGAPGKKVKMITDKDIEAILQMDGVDVATPVITMEASMKSGRFENNWVQIKGMNLEFLNKYGLNIYKGRMLEKADKMAVVFGTRLPFEFFDKSDKNPEWQWPWDDEGNLKEPKLDVLKGNMLMNINNRGNNQEGNPYRIKVVGVTSDKNWQKNSCAYMEFKQLKKIKDKLDRENDYAEYGGRRPPKGYKQVLVKVPDREKVKAVQNSIKDMGFEARSDIDELEQSNKITMIIQAVFGGIGAISLLVAAIGITNTMVMAIYERRKEIGVMKVIGASLKDIKRLFLFESASIGLLGGIFGLLLSLGASKIVNIATSSFMEKGMGSGGNLSVIPLWLMAGSLVFTTLIGLLSGYLPARKAMKLSALEAIRTE
jgi:ABC-type antimicrobial peptide transport system permease subunit